ncbi:hypothetical protein ACLB2K_028868 [Fragaria x ananassa]
MFSELRRAAQCITQPMSMFGWFNTCLEFLSKAEFALLLIILWSVWKERNLRVWEGKSRTGSQVFYQVRSYDTLIRSCLLKKVGGKRQFRPWVPPPNGWLKANFDGAVDSTTKCGGIGVVFRDEQSLIVGGKYCCIAHVNSPEIVEAMAGRMACELAKELHLFLVVFESDCLKLVQATKHQEEDDSGFGVIVADIQHGLAELNSSFFSHVFRQSNLVAHKLAKLALDSANSVSWAGSPPVDLQGLLASSCSS